MVTISVCMIVKDEEAVLSRCLESLKHLADEIIIVDTGSLDKTKDIALQYTDKVYDFQWIHDFSAARNYSFEKATMDYIYVADADEVIDEENQNRFLFLKENLIPEIEIVQMMYANQLSYNTTYNFDKEYRPKLYKRLRHFRWIDPIHESVDLNPMIYDSDITIYHLPQNNHAPRDFKVFQRIIGSSGNLSSRLYEMYAKELFIAGEDKDFLDAFDFYEKYSNSENVTERERKIYECILARCYRLRQDLKGLMKIGLKNIADEKSSAEVCYELGEYFFHQNDYKEAIIWFYNAAYETESELNIRYAGDYSLQRLSSCYHFLGERQQEEAYQALSEAWLKDYMG